MKKWLFRIAVILCALLVLAVGGWWGWREFYSADQIWAAMDSGDAERIATSIRWGARADRVESLLHWTAQKDNRDLAEFLLAHGADPFSCTLPAGALPQTPWESRRPRCEWFVSCARVIVPVSGQ